MSIKIDFVCHASMIFRTQDCVIWTDPWLHGRAFNESWALYPAPYFDPKWYSEITHLWISHEHPDHFHIPTLKSLPEDFRRRVEILFQRNNSQKVFDALRKFGFTRFREMPHRTWMPLTDATEVYCAQIGNMDSSLAVRSGGVVVLDLNDCEANTADCRMLRRDLGNIEVVLNQFSMAGYSGEDDHDRFLPANAKRIRDTVIENHRDLGANITIPIASFIYFCKSDNCYINSYANTPMQVCDEMTALGLNVVVMYPGDSWEVGQPYDSRPALEKYRADYSRLAAQPIDAVDTVPLEEIRKAFHDRVTHLRKKYPRLVIKRLKPVVCRVPDLNVTVRWNISGDEFEVLDPAAGAPCDVTINSQPLHFMFRFPWGLQTLGVSARLQLHRHGANWRRYRILFSLDNAEIYLKPRLLMSRRNLRWFVERLPGAWNQLRYQLRRMKPRT